MTLVSRGYHDPLRRSTVQHTDRKKLYMHWIPVEIDLFLHVPTMVQQVYLSTHTPIRQASLDRFPNFQISRSSTPHPPILSDLLILDTRQPTLLAFDLHEEGLDEVCLIFILDLSQLCVQRRRGVNRGLATDSVVGDTSLMGDVRIVRCRWFLVHWFSTSRDLSPSSSGGTLTRGRGKVLDRLSPFTRLPAQTPTRL